MTTLSNAKLPSLKDKINAQAEAAEKVELKDEEVKKEKVAKKTRSKK